MTYFPVDPLSFTGLALALGALVFYAGLKFRAWLACVVVAGLLLGCGPSAKPTTFRPVTGPKAVTTTIPLATGDMIVHYDEALTTLERTRAAEAIVHHWNAAQALAHPVSSYLGQAWPPRGSWHVWVHRRHTVGEPFAPPVLGLVAHDGAHVVLGDGQVVPDFVHQLVHLWYAPRESHDFPVGFWPRVLDVQNQSVQLLKLRRGVP